MKIVLISDTHNQHTRVQLPEGDIIIHAGDISSRGSVEEAFDFMEWFSKLPYKHKIFIAGNHDFCFERNEIKMTDIPSGVIYLQDSMCSVEGFNIYGSPYTPEFYNWAFMKKRGEELKMVWDAIPANVDILITHGPPFTILDKTAVGRFAGCEDLFRRVKELKPKIHIFGHIHERYGITQEQGTTFVNASVLNEEYRLVNQPIVTELLI